MAVNRCLPVMWCGNEQRRLNDMNIREVEQLKQKIDNVNERLVYAKAQIESAKKRQVEILKECDCNSVEELQQLVNAKEQELNQLVNAAKQYIQNTLPAIEQVEKAVQNA